MHIGKKNNEYKYYLNDGDNQIELAKTYLEKDLGFLIIGNLKFEDQCIAAANKSKTKGKHVKLIYGKDYKVVMLDQTFNMLYLYSHHIY